MEKRHFKTAEEIRAAFIKEGWSKDITITKATAAEIEKQYGISHIKDSTYFIMEETGNVFTDTGEIFLYNLGIRKVEADKLKEVTA